MSLMFLCLQKWCFEWMNQQYECSLLQLVYKLLLMSWLSIDASNGFHSFDSNSFCFYQLREDSPNDQQPPLFNLPFDCHYERSMNFSDLPLFRDLPKSEQIASPKNQRIEQDSNQWKFTTSSTRKGLRCLAELLVRLLRKGPLQQSEIVPMIENILCKGKQQQGKEQKNVKRRIYDAVNVMIAAGLLEKQDAEIRIKKSEPSSVLLDLQPIKQINQIQERLEKKRQYLAKVKSQKKALEYWMKRNKGKPSGETFQQLLFPLIFVLEEEDSFWMHYLRDCILIKAKSVNLFSEIDLIESVYNIQNGGTIQIDSD